MWLIELFLIGIFCAAAAFAAFKVFSESMITFNAALGNEWVSVVIIVLTAVLLVIALLEYRLGRSRARQSFTMLIVPFLVIFVPMALQILFGVSVFSTESAVTAVKTAKVGLLWMAVLSVLGGLIFSIIASVYNFIREISLIKSS